MNIKRIFLDVDDVLVDFTFAAMSEIGINTGRIDKESFYERWGYDIVAASNYYRMPEPFLTAAEFWRKFDRRFWATLDRTKECDTLIRASCEIVGVENVFLLTGPINDPECAAGKMELIRDTFPDFWKDRRYMIAPPKYACAYLGALLIDDSDRNVNEFRAAGGQAALVPQPWNSEHALSGEPLSFTRLL